MFTPPSLTTLDSYVIYFEKNKMGFNSCPGAIICIIGLDDGDWTLLVYRETNCYLFTHSFIGSFIYFAKYRFAPKVFLI